MAARAAEQSRPQVEPAIEAGEVASGQLLEELDAVVDVDVEVERIRRARPGAVAGEEDSRVSGKVAAEALLLSSSGPRTPALNTAQLGGDAGQQ